MSAVDDVRAAWAARGFPVETPPAPAPVSVRAAASVPAKVATGPAAPATSTGTIITAGLLQRLGAHDPAGWAPVLAAACVRRAIDTPLRVAALLANIFVETGHLSNLSESLDYSPASLLREWPLHFDAESAQRLGRTSAHPADQRGIAELAYGGRNGNRAPGDAWTYRGGGGLQTTGLANYAALAKDIGWTGTLTALADYVRTPVGAAESAASYWQTHNLNVPADRGDIVTVRRVINGGLNGLADCKANYLAACIALNAIRRNP